MFAAKSLGVVTGVFLLATMVSTRAEADALSCPSPLQTGQNNTYTVDSVARPIDCAWGNGNLSANNDDFKDGNGTNDPGNSLFPLVTEVGPSPETFNLAWTFLGSTNSWSNGPGSAIAGLTFSNSTNTSTNFTINPALAGGGGLYALGIKDGANPQWAVFLLNVLPGGLSGVASMTGGSFSHMALWGAPGGPTTFQQLPVPEPASLALLGSGLALMASKARKRLKKRA